MSQYEFNDDQKQYLQGFVSGAELGRAARGLATFAATLGLVGESNGAALGLGKPAAPGSTPTGLDALGIMAQDRTIAEGKKLCSQEEARRKRHPLDMWGDIV